MVRRLVSRLAAQVLRCRCPGSAPRVTAPPRSKIKTVTPPLLTPHFYCLPQVLVRHVARPSLLTFINSKTDLPSPFHKAATMRLGSGRLGA